MLPNYQQVMPPEDWLEVFNGLLDLRRRGILYAVWIDEWVIHIQWGQWAMYREPLPWVRARHMIEAHGAHRKGPESVIITGEKERVG